MLLENKEYRTIINKHISDESLKSLILELIQTHNEIYQQNLKKSWTNDLINRIKDDLRFRSSTTAIEEIDFSRIQLEKIKAAKFRDLVKKLQTEKEIDSKEIRGFRVVARTKNIPVRVNLKQKVKELYHLVMP